MRSLTTPLGKLPETAWQNLQNFLIGRPEIELPAHLADLEGTHGWFMGDARPVREIVCGFKPAFVVFTSPVFPDGPRRWVDGEFYCPPLHAQPEVTERGFKVGLKYNDIGMTTVYVVWKTK